MYVRAAQVFSHRVMRSLPVLAGVCLIFASGCRTAREIAPEPVAQRPQIQVVPVPADIDRLSPQELPAAEAMIARANETAKSYSMTEAEAVRPDVQKDLAPADNTSSPGVQAAEHSANLHDATGASDISQIKGSVVAEPKQLDLQNDADAIPSTGSALIDSVVKSMPQAELALDSTTSTDDSTEVTPVAASGMPEPITSGSSDDSSVSDPIGGCGEDSILGGCHGRESYCLRDDFHDFWPMLWDDAKGVANWNNALILSAAAGASILIRQDLDGEVRKTTAAHPDRWGKGSMFLGHMGEVQYQVPVLLAVYGYSLHAQDCELHEFSSALISAYTITGLSTLAIKGVVNTDRPSDEWNNGEFGFPSFHTASSFAIAAVVDDYYGPEAGIPAYLTAGLIGWSRIDERDHDLSDVVFGAALGYVIGKSVAGKHRDGDSRVRLLPYVHPTDGSSGLMLEWPF